MSQFTISTFEQAVARYFEPIARQNGWPLIRCSDHLYEIPSPHWVMQVSFHEGAHTRSMNVTLRSGSQKASDSHGGDGEIGVWPIAGYNGVPFKYIPWEQTAEGFLEEA